MKVRLTGFAGFMIGVAISWHAPGSVPAAIGYGNALGASIFGAMCSSGS